MSELKNFPAIDQTHESTSDGNVDENANDNCVPASIAAILEYFTGSTFNGDELKDLAYGQGYQGLQDAAMFVGIAASHGVHMTQLYGTSAFITSQIHKEIQAGHAVLCYVGWDYDVSVPHAVAFFSERSGYLTAMNPWGGIYQERSDSDWQTRGVGFFYNTMWVFSGNDPQAQEATGVYLTDNNAFFQAYFTRVDAQRIHCAQHNLDVAYAILDHFLNTGGQMRLPVSAEFQIATNATAQVFESGIIVYDPKRVFDNPPLTGDCYFVKINGGVGQKLIARALLDPLNAQIATQLKELQDDAQQITALQQEVAQLQQKLTEAPAPVDLSAYKARFDQVATAAQQILDLAHAA